MGTGMPGCHRKRPETTWCSAGDFQGFLEATGTRAPVLRSALGGGSLIA